MGREKHNTMTDYAGKLVVMNSNNDEMKKNPKLRKEDIKALVKWHDEQLHLPKIYESDFALFLHCNFYDVEVTKEHIENYYTMRTHLPEFFANRDPLKNEALIETFNTVSVIPLEKRSKDGYKVILTRLIDTDPTSYVFDEAVKYLNMVLDLCVYEEGTNDGYMIVIDLNGANIKHSTRLAWLSLKKFLLYNHKACPIRWKGLHYINSAKDHDKLQEFVLKNIVNNKLVDKIYFYSSMEEANEVFSLDILPNEMGGKAGPIQSLHKAQIKKLESYRDWFVNTESCYKVDETLRKGGPLNARQLFGAEIDFKNLDID